MLHRYRVVQLLHKTENNNRKYQQQQLCTTQYIELLYIYTKTKVIAAKLKYFRVLAFVFENCWCNCVCCCYRTSAKYIICLLSSVSVCVRVCVCLYVIRMFSVFTQTKHNQNRANTQNHLWEGYQGESYFGQYCYYGEALVCNRDTSILFQMSMLVVLLPNCNNWNVLEVGRHLLTFVGKSSYCD